MDTTPWFEGKRFTKDFVRSRIDTWMEVLKPLKEVVAPDILEIGSWEGRSATFFLHYLPAATITCVDPFPKARKEAFKENLAEFGSRVTMIVAFSFPALVRLRRQRASFDFIYIDGNHRRECVFLDSILSWPMLRRNGILIWDDYAHYKKKAADYERVPLAVDGFLHGHPGEYEVLSNASQMIVKKTVHTPEDWPDAYLTCALREPPVTFSDV